MARWYEDLLASIVGQISDRFPATLNLEEQGLFALGYYQQLAKMRPPKNDAGQDTETTDNHADDEEQN